MSTTTNVQESVSDEANCEPTVEQLLEQVADGRVTVQRVLEYVRGERDHEIMKGSDYLKALNHVRRDLDETLVLYIESETGVTAIARTGDHGAIETKRWNEHFGGSHQFEFYDVVSDDVHKANVEILRKEEAHKRFDAFVREHSDEHGGDA